jgi:hypothetical protein
MRLTILAHPAPAFWTRTRGAQLGRIMVRYLVELIGNLKLIEHLVRDVGSALGTLAERSSTGSVRLARMILIQAIRNSRRTTSWYGTSRTWLAYPAETVETESGPV